MRVRKDFKMYQDVVVIYLGKEGYIDAIVNGSYRVKLIGTYEWCEWYHLIEKENYKPEQEKKPIKVNKFDYL